LIFLQAKNNKYLNAAKKLDEVLNTWRERPLGKIEYLVVDARYEQVRVDNRSINMASLNSISMA
jgi:transposase-like protein